jgi:uncharacterized protein (DUF488 family)
MTLPFFTIGHSTRPVAELIDLLRDSEIGVVADIRRFPGSRTNPQYGAGALAASLGEAGIDYVHLPVLGGRRSAQPGVPAETNAFWRERSFHNYADFALSDEFWSGLAALLDLGRDRRVALMCAEAVWWRCHRRIITDYLLAAGRQVFHILGKGHIEPAQMTPAARIDPDVRITYPADDLLGRLGPDAGARS